MIKATVEKAGILSLLLTIITLEKKCTLLVSNAIVLVDMLFKTKILAQEYIRMSSKTVIQKLAITMN